MEVVCVRCGSRQRPEPEGHRVAVVAVEDAVALLRGRPPWLACTACGTPLPIESTDRIVGVGWEAMVRLDGTGRPPPLDPALERRIASVYEGVLADLRRASGSRAREAVALNQFREITAEAVAAALLVARGAVPSRPDWPPPMSVADVDEVLGRAQGVALVAGALAAAADQDAVLADVIDRYVAPETILPLGVEGLRSGVGAMLARGGLSQPERLCLLAVHAATHATVGLPDPLAVDFSRLWIALAWAAQTDETGDLERFRLPEALLSVAVDPGELVRAVYETVDAPAGWMERLQKIAEMAGRPRLVREVARNSPAVGEASTETLRAALAELTSRGRQQPALVEGLRYVLGVLVSSGRVTDLAPMTEYAITLGDGTAETRAALLAQLGSAANAVRSPGLFLDVVGDRPAPWEASLSDTARLVLTTERSTALRISGRPDDALAVLGPMRDLALDDDSTWRLEFNLAVIERDRGDPGKGLSAIEGLLARATDRQQRFLAHQSLARAATTLGRHTEAIGHLRAAIELADGAEARQEATLRGHLAALLAAEGDTEGALAEIALVENDARSSPQAVLGVADAITLLLERGVDIEEVLIAETVTHLIQLETDSTDRADWTVRASALRVRSRLRELTGDTEGAVNDWATLLDLIQDPMALAALAVLRLQRGDVAEARRLLLAIPDALRDDYGTSQDASLLVDATGRLRVELQRISTTMMASRPAPTDVRFAAELSRDAIGRSRSWRRSSSDPPSRRALADMLADRHLVHLAPARGSLWVLEWWQGARGVVSLLSRIRSDVEAPIEFRALPAMPADAPDVSRQVLARLQNWWPGRPGDPLAHSGWYALQDWLRQEMAEATDEDHLVVLEHAGLTGLPWHATQAPWTTSYAPSWSALLDLPKDRRPVARLGLATVVARADAGTTLDAFVGAAHSIRATAARHGVSVDVVDGSQADATAVRRLLRDADVVTILSHGLVDPEQREVALLVARDGILPTQHPIAAASAEGRAHRLTWQSLQHLDGAASVVLSGACSTGQGLVAGMGERLGLFGALRSAGTRAVVAPAWDAVASDVPAQLARICELILNGVPLARAIRDTADALADELPPWRRRVLCVEGDWR